MTIILQIYRFPLINIDTARFAKDCSIMKKVHSDRSHHLANWQ